MSSRACAWLLALAALAALPARAAAYCRETVDTKATGPCFAAGTAPVLVWTRSCITQVFEQSFFSRLPLLTEAQIRDAFAQSFAAWSELQCGADGAPFYVTQRAGVTKTSAAGFLFDERNEALIVARNRAEWAELGHFERALALTLLWHDKSTGEILDVDMELNTGAGRFTDCDKPCGRDMMDLRNTITHEAGHLLGLGHTTADGATMIDDAPDGETGKRTLEPDDIEGYCALELPSHDCAGAGCRCEAPPIYPSSGQSAGCACAIAGAQPSNGARGLPLLGLLCGVFVLRRRRGRGRPV